MINWSSHFSIRRDVAIVVIVKLLLAAYFLYLFNKNYDGSRLYHGLAVNWGDTNGYLNPIEYWLDQSVPLDACRMPGHLPLYAPLYSMLGREWASVGLIIIQFILSIVSVICLARLAFLILRTKFVYYSTLILYSISTFVSIWDLVLMADSFSISLLIISCYLFWAFLNDNKWKYLIYFGLAFSGSFFFRQISVAIAPVFLILLWQRSYKHIGLKHFIKSSICAFIVPAVFLASWSLYNFNQNGRFILFVKPINECCGAFTLERLKAGEVLNNWGLNMVHWRPESPGAWFFSKDFETVIHPDISSKATINYPADSILSLKNAYTKYRNCTNDSAKTIYGNQFVLKADYIINDFKLQRPWYARVFSRIGLLYSFIFPVTLDNLPLPKRSDMNGLEFLVKISYYALLILINILALVGSIYFFIYTKKIDFYIIIIPWVLCLMLALWLGYIEQRYFAPIYPYFLIISVFFANAMGVKFFKSYPKIKGLMAPEDSY